MVKGQIPWNRGIHLPEEYRRNISRGKTGVRLQQQHKDRISESQKKRWETIREKICDQCSIKSKWIYGVSLPSVTSHTLRLCDRCFLRQYFGLSQEERKGVRIVE